MSLYKQRILYNVGFIIVKQGTLHNCANGQVYHPTMSEIETKETENNKNLRGATMKAEKNNSIGNKGNNTEQRPLFIKERLRIPLQSGLLTIGACQILNEEMKEFQHSHAEYEIYYCLQGVMKMKIREEILHLQPGDFVVIEPQVLHMVIDQPHMQWEYLILMFDPSRLRTDGEQNNETEMLKAIRELFRFDDGEKNDWLLIKDHRHCDDLIRLIEKDYNEKLYGWQLSVSIKICWLLMELFRNRLPVPETSGKASENGQNMTENTAILIDQYIHRNYMYDVSVDDAAEFFYMTPRTINRILQQYLGISFQRLLMIERLNRAKLFLIETGDSIEEITAMVGLKSTGSLYRLFRENEGMSPAEYRSMYRI